MKLTFNRADFLQAARKLCKVAPETSPVSTLTGILLEADAQNFEVTMTATNLEVSMSCSLSAAVIEGGSTMINAVLFTDMLRLLGEATVTMEVLPNLQMQENSGSASYTIMTLNAADYPKIKLPEPAHAAVITNLHTLVKSTAFVVPKATQNLSLKCVKLEISENNVRTAGTDGMRLMICKKHMEESNTALTLLIPCDCFSLLAGMVEDSDKLTLESSAKYAVFTGEQMTFTTRLGVGSYIDVDSVLGCITGCYEALADAKELYTALDMLAAVASASDQVRMIFIPGSLSLFCDGEEITSEGRTVDIPVISFFAASNEIPNFSDPAESILRPLYDRFQLKVVTDYVQDREKRLDMLAKMQAVRGGTMPTAYVTLEELVQMQEEVAQVAVSPAINELMDDVLCDLRHKNIHVSDRKYFNFYPIVQAKAWLDGRDEVQPFDLLCLESYLWTTPEELPEIQQTLGRKCVNPLKDKADAIRTQGLEVLDAFREDMQTSGSKAIVKFRGEIVTVYRQAKPLEDEAESNNDHAIVNALLYDLNEFSRQAHEAVNFTAVPLDELAALN